MTDPLEPRGQNKKSKTLNDVIDQFNRQFAINRNIEIKEFTKDEILSCCEGSDIVVAEWAKKRSDECWQAKIKQLEEENRKLREKYLNLNKESLREISRLKDEIEDLKAEL